MAANMPHWRHVGDTVRGHPKFAWVDPQGNEHIVTGSIGPGTKKKEIEFASKHLARHANACEGGGCNHVFSPTSTEPTPEALATAQADQPHVPGTQVSHEGEPKFVTAAEVIDGTPYYDLAHATTGEPSEMVPHYALDDPEDGPHVASILDPIQSQLDPRVFLDPASPQPTLRPELAQWITQVIFEALERHGYDNPAKWLTLVMTGSLTTYQYGDSSDADVSLFVDSKKFPDWSRAEMISIMVSDFDNVDLPGTPHPLQAYVVPHDLKPKDLYKPGLRSGYVVYGKNAGTWIVPPDRERVHDVEKEMNDAYTVGLLSADKLDLLLRFEPEQAREYWETLHQKRRMDQAEGKGDFATSNVVWKMIANRFGDHPFAQVANLT